MIQLEHVPYSALVYTKRRPNSNTRNARRRVLASAAAAVAVVLALSPPHAARPQSVGLTFAAWEQPALFAAEVRAAFRSLR